MIDAERRRCIDPSALSDDDLVAHVRGEGSAAIAGHIARCPRCRDTAAQYARADSLLSSRLFRRACPATLTLGEYAAGLLDPAERLRVAGHLAECPLCADEARGFVRFLEEDDTPSAEPGIFTAVRRLLARPLTAAPALAGLRGDAATDSLTYAADGVQLVLSVQRGAPGAGSMILGMFSEGGGTAAGSPARLYTTDTLLQTETIDDLASFQFSRVSAGAYRIELEMTDTLIILEPITVP